MNAYFELSPAITGAPHKNLAAYDIKLSASGHLPARYIGVIQASERVWLEDNDSVWFMKNKLVDPHQPVDLKEFFWVKLKSVSM